MRPSCSASPRTERARPRGRGTQRRSSRPSAIRQSPTIASCSGSATPSLTRVKPHTSVRMSLRASSAPMYATYGRAAGGARLSAASASASANWPQPKRTTCASSPSSRLISPASELRRRVDARPLLANGSERQPLHHVAPRREVLRVGEGKHFVYEALGARSLSRLRPERYVGIEIQDPGSTAKRRGHLKQRREAQTLERDAVRTPASRVSPPGDQRLGNSDVRSRDDHGCVVPVDFGECLEEALRDHADTAPSVLSGGRVDYELRHSRRGA